MPHIRYAVAFLLLIGVLPGATVSSPNRRITLTAEVKENLEPYPAGKRLYYSVAVDGKTVVLESGFRLDFKGAPPLAKDLAVVDEARRTIDETWDSALGQRRRIRNHANELALAIQETAGPKRR